MSRAAATRAPMSSCMSNRQPAMWGHIWIMHSSGCTCSSTASSPHHTRLVPQHSDAAGLVSPMESTRRCSLFRHWASTISLDAILGIRCGRSFFHGQISCGAAARQRASEGLAIFARHPGWLRYRTPKRWLGAGWLCVAMLPMPNSSHSSGPDWFIFVSFTCCL